MGDDSLDSKQSFVQTSTETIWQFDRSFVGYQLDHVPNTVVNSRAVAAFLKMVLNPERELRRESALHVIRQLLANRVAIDF